MKQEIINQLEYYLYEFQNAADTADYCGVSEDEVVKELYKNMLEDLTNITK